MSTRHLTLFMMRRTLGRMLRDTFKGGAIQVCSPSFVRRGVMEACSMDRDQFPIVSCMDDPPLSLVGGCLGVGLPTMSTFLVDRIVVKEASCWPLLFFTAGVAYSRRRGEVVATTSTAKKYIHSFEQRNVFSVLALATEEAEWLEMRAQLQQLLDSFFIDTSGRDIGFEPLQDGSPRWNYECLARNIVVRDDAGGQVVGRISDVGTYIPERIHLYFEEDKNEQRHPHMAFLEINLSTFVDSLSLPNKHD